MISVIVPIYNVEKYLVECIESILAQTYTDFELILVNDGSTDGSENICNKYQNEDARVKVIHQQNAGVSAARNTGINSAKGDWISFIDGDDSVLCNYLSNLVKITTQETDFVMAGLTHRHMDVDIYDGPKESGNFIINDSNTYLKLINRPLITSPVSKLYKASIIKSNKLLFDDSLRFGEDRKFNLRYSYYVKSYSVAETSDYIYYNRKTSLTHIVNYSERLESDMNYCMNLANELRNLNYYNTEAKISLANKYFNSINDNLIQLGKNNISPNHLFKILKKAYKNSEIIYYELLPFISYVRLNHFIGFLFSKKKFYLLSLLYKII